MIGDRVDIGVTSADIGNSPVGNGSLFKPSVRPIGKAQETTHRERGLRTTPFSIDWRHKRSRFQSGGAVGRPDRPSIDSLTPMSDPPTDSDPADYVARTCPECGTETSEDAPAYRFTVLDVVVEYRFCSERHRRLFEDTASIDAIREEIARRLRASGYDPEDSD